MRYPRDFIDRVISNANLVELVSQYTVLKRQGKNLWGRCPFPDHKEKTPSFSVSEDKNMFHCFGCKKGGNIVNFLQYMSGMSFPEAIEYLAHRAHIALPQPASTAEIKKEKETRDHKSQLQHVNRLAQFYFSENLRKQSLSQPVWQYISKRKISEESIDTFKIGYASAEWDGLVRYLEKKSAPLEMAEELGLVRMRSDAKTGYYDLFRDRLMFTIMSSMGDPIGFGGRVLDDSLPKYINSPESPLFHKGQGLFGLNQTAKFIRSQDQVILVEGYMDLIGLFQAGVGNIAAPLGTALTRDQVRILSRMTKNVMVLFDGDRAGQEAAEKSLGVLLEAQCLPKGLILPDGKDPDEYILENGVESLEEHLKKAKDLYSIVLSKWLRGFTGAAVEKVQILERLRPILSLKTISAPLKTLYITEAATRMNVDPKWLWNALAQSRLTPEPMLGASSSPLASTANSRPINSSQPDLSQVQNVETPRNLKPEDALISLKGASKIEILTLALALRGGRETWDSFLHVTKLKTQLEVHEMLNHPGVLQVLERAAQVAGQMVPNSANLMSLLANEIESANLLTAAVHEIPEVGSEGETKLMDDCIRRLRTTQLDRQVRVLATSMKANHASDHYSELYEQLMALQKEKRRLMEPGSEPLN